MKKILVCVLVLLVCSVCYAGDRSTEYVLNRIWNSGSGSIDTVGVGASSFEVVRRTQTVKFQEDLKKGLLSKVLGASRISICIINHDTKHHVR